MKTITYRATARKTLLAFDWHKSASLGDLAQRVRKSKSAVCRALKKLVQVGHVERRQLTQSRRGLVFVRSDDGNALVCAWLNIPRGTRLVEVPTTPVDVMRN